jgi:hypothetical protein
LQEVGYALDKFRRDHHFRRDIADFRRTKFSNCRGLFSNIQNEPPHAVLIVVIYILGMVTGGGLGTLVKQAFEGARSL